MLYYYSRRPAMPPAASPSGGRRMSPDEEALRSSKRPCHPVDSGSGPASDSSSGSGSDAMPPAANPGGGRRMSPDEEALRLLKRPRHPVDSGSGSDSDGDFVSDLREIACLLRLIKGGANKDGQKMCQQIIARVAADIQTMLEETKSRFEKERQNLLKVLSHTSKECESSLTEEYTQLQETYEMFCEEKDAHLQTFKDLFSQIEVEKKKLLEQYEHYREEETTSLSELGDTFSEKITNAKPPRKRMKQDDKSFIIFRKSIGSYLECGSDNDFDLDNE